jgi:hypothetical protein
MYILLRIMRLMHGIATWAVLSRCSELIFTDHLRTHEYFNVHAPLARDTLFAT